MATCKPQVSVIIPAYNVEAYLAQAIDSVLSQTYPPSEIIVVNDGSTDHTADIARSYRTSVILISQNNKGLSGARNTGIKAAGGNWIAFLDADDTWDRNKLEAQISIINRYPNLHWLSCNSTLVWSDTQEERTTNSARLIAALSNNDCFDSFFHASVTGILWAGGSTMVIKKEVFEHIGLFNTAIRYAEDIEMWWRIAGHWPAIGFVSAPLVNYFQQRTGSLTHKTSQARQVTALFRIYQKELIRAHLNDYYSQLNPLFIHELMKLVDVTIVSGRNNLIRQALTKFYYDLPLRYRLWLFSSIIGSPREYLTTKTTRKLLAFLRNIPFTIEFSRFAGR